MKLNEGVGWRCKDCNEIEEVEQICSRHCKMPELELNLVQHIVKFCDGTIRVKSAVKVGDAASILPSPMPCAKKVESHDWRKEQDHLVC